jgi:Arc/MetJ-type ribon-helix-helix transcriptional regulator
MSPEMSADNERFLDQLVETGVYPSRRHAIDDALALLRRREELLKGLRISAEQAARGELLEGSEVLDRFEARAREIEAKARGEA